MFFIHEKKMRKIFKIQSLKLPRFAHLVPYFIKVDTLAQCANKLKILLEGT